MRSSSDSVLKKLPAVQEVQVQSLGWDDPLEEEMETHSSILDGEIPWTEEPGGYSPWVKRVRHNWATEHTHIQTHTMKMKVSSCNSKSLSSCIHFSLIQVVSTVTWTTWICFDLIKYSYHYLRDMMRSWRKKNFLLLRP